MSKRELRVSINFSVPVSVDAFEQAKVVAGFAEAVKGLRSAVEIVEGTFVSDARVVTPKSAQDGEPQLPLVGSVPPPPLAVEFRQEEKPVSEDDLLKIPGFLRRESPVVIEGSNQAAP